MRVGASGYNSRYIAYEIRCLQGRRSHERLRGGERKGRGSEWGGGVCVVCVCRRWGGYGGVAVGLGVRVGRGGDTAFGIRRKLLCCHQPFGGKHSELVCVAASGYNCLDMDIVSMDRERRRGAGVAEGGVWG